jgi:hypothetical protein
MSNYPLNPKTKFPLRTGKVAECRQQSQVENKSWMKTKKRIQNAASLVFKPESWKNKLDNWRSQQRLIKIAEQVAVHAKPTESNLKNITGPTIFFNASARLGSLSQNAAFSLLTSWALQLAGVRVIHFVCHSGLQPCVLGTNREDYTKPPPCISCIALSKKLFTGAETYPFHLPEDVKESSHSVKNSSTTLSALIANLDVEALSNFTFHSLAGDLPEIPLGRLVLPSARWALRRHDIEDTPQDRYLLRQYILSAYHTILQFNALIRQTSPSCVIIFNGIMYPEAAARWVAHQHNLRVITHEVGFQRFSAFFCEGDATAYPIEIPPDFELNVSQNQRLDSYLEKRFQGQFSMAGIQFWPEMHSLDPAFLQKASQFQQVVPIFTNVVYDTSQIHANILFPHMFAWLDLLRQIIQSHPETLFVIRAHPDEMRPGTAKQSRQTVSNWVEENGLLQYPNVIFIDSQEFISSYELIQKSKFVLVYNSSIGLEAALMGKPVICGGKARYTQYPTVFFPPDILSYHRQVEEFLTVKSIPIPEEFQRNARRFLYYQLYKASLSFEKYLENAQKAGFVNLKPFHWQDLLPDQSMTIKTILNGVLYGEEFLMPETDFT